MSKRKQQQNPAGRLAVNYARVSTRDQAERGQSIADQQRRYKAWCVAHDVRDDGTFADRGVSGRSVARRGELEQALEKVCQAKGVLVVYSLSRLARSAADAEKICERLRAHGADLVSLTEPIDTTTAMGRAFFGIVSVFARLESDLIGERIRAALEHKRQQRKRWFGKMVPFGWRMSADGSHVVQVRSEQAVIAKMRRWRREGRGYGWIARRLERAGVRTKTGKRKWQRMVIWKILKSDARLAAAKRSG